MTDDPDIRIGQSVMDYIFRRLALDYLPVRDAAPSSASSPPRSGPPRCRADGSSAATADASRRRTSTSSELRSSAPIETARSSREGHAGRGRSRSTAGALLDRAARAGHRARPPTRRCASPAARRCARPAAATSARAAAPPAAAADQRPGNVPAGSESNVLISDSNVRSSAAGHLRPVRPVHRPGSSSRAGPVAFDEALRGAEEARPSVCPRSPSESRRCFGSGLATRDALST